MHFQFSQFTNGMFRSDVRTDLEVAFLETTENSSLNSSFHFCFVKNWRWTDPGPPRLLLSFFFFFFLILFCSRCLFISQRLCVNMSIQIKHIVCIYCLFTCIACKNNHSSFHVYSIAALLKLRVGDAKWAAAPFPLEGIRSPEWVQRSASALFVSTKKSLRRPEEKLYIKA